MEEPNELLIIFEILIQKYGGRSVLLRQLEWELQHLPVGKAKYNWTRDSTNFLIENYKTMSARHIANKLNITHNIAFHKISELKNQGLLPEHRKPRTCNGYNRLKNNLK